MDRAILVFVAIAYALSIALSLVVGLTGGHASPIAGLGFLSMFIPATAVLVVRFAMGERVSSVGLSRFPLKYLPLVLLMPAVLHAVMLPLTAMLEGGLQWHEWLTPQADGLFHTPESRGWGTMTATGLMGRVVANAGAGILFVSLLAFFEEVGWRAWLLPRLADRMGARRAIVITAVIWAFWHTPFALSGILYIDGMSQAATAMIMPIGQVGAGLVIGWLWLRSESMWLVTIAHGALNSWGQYAFKFMQDFVRADQALVLGVGNVGLLLVGSLLAWQGLASTQRPVAGPLEPEQATARLLSTRQRY
ncbi:MAG: CPBP family intramembrane glutamic endopeptidase [Vicinamibacterales bacterium]|jgi:membrane protease YdiL (CAAX protease family)